MRLTARPDAEHDGGDAVEDRVDTEDPDEGQQDTPPPPPIVLTSGLCLSLLGGCSALPASRYRVWAEARRTRRRRDRTLDRVNTAAVLADAMTDYVLTVGVGRGPPPPGRRNTWRPGWRPTATTSFTTRRSTTERPWRHARPRPPDQGHGRARLARPRAGPGSREDRGGAGDAATAAARCAEIDLPDGRS